MMLQALSKLAGSSQIVFGSDYPFGTIVNIADGLRTCGFSPEEMRGVDRENAVRILPKYKT